MTVLPLTTVLGTVGGTSVGKAVAHNSPYAAEKAALLRPAWSALNQRAPLADLVARRLPPRPDAGMAPPWRAQVGYAVLGTAGSGPDRPFALRATARVAVWYASEAKPRVEKAYVAQSESLTLEQWRADDAQALRRALDDLAAALAEQVANDAMKPQRTSRP